MIPMTFHKTIRYRLVLGMGCGVFLLLLLLIGSSSRPAIASRPTCPPPKCWDDGHCEPIECYYTPTPTPVPPAWKGIAASSELVAKIEGDLRSSWWYVWGTNPSYLSNPRYVPMIAGRTAPSDLSTSAATAPRDRAWLVFNEPDNLENISGAEAASLYASYYDTIKAGSGGTARILVGGTVYMPATTVGGAWWSQFLSQVQRPIEGVHIHAYPGQGWHGYFSTRQDCQNPYPQYGGNLSLVAPCMINDLQDAYSFFQSQPKTRGKPFWITEASILGKGLVTSENMRDYYMVPLVNWFVSAKNGQYPLFERFAWYADRDTSGFYPDSNLVNPDGTLTALGNQWRTY